MGKSVVKQIEKLKEEQKMSENIKNKIQERIIVNSAICISIIMLVAIFELAANHLNQKIATTTYNIYSIIFLLFTLVIFEIGYKKDSGKWALTGVEILIVSLIVLFAPYLFIKFNKIIIYIIMILITLYYIIKISTIYVKENKKYKKSLSDIPQIIKKESKDELAKEYEQKMDTIKDTEQKDKKATINSKKKKTKGTDDVKKSKTKKTNTTNKVKSKKNNNEKKTNLKENKKDTIAKKTKTSQTKQVKK